MSKLNPCINLPLPDDEINEIIQTAKDWAIMHGLSLRTPAQNLDEVQIVPFLLLPSTFPKAEFQKAVNMQTTLNELMHKVAYDHDFLSSCLSSTIKTDDFTEKLFQIYQTVYNDANFKNAYHLGIIRSDYMLHSESNKIKQIEIGAIATSFGGLSAKASEYHRFILSVLGHTNKLSNLPVNDSIREISSGLVEAWTFYNNPRSIILFVTEDFTMNISDQRSVEFEINLLNPKIKVIRRSMKTLINQVRLGPKNELMVGKDEVSVVYYRAAYDPCFYPTEKEWDLRLTMEKSKAIKCPSIQYQLAGTKKVQQMLSMPNILKKFTKSDEEFRRVKDLFVSLYALEHDDDGEKAVAMALKNPKKFVLKPQREGGGHNVFDDDIKTMLQSPEMATNRPGYILMDKINPPPQENYLIKAGANDSDKIKNVVSELGIYGVIFGNQNKIIVNKQAGFLLRTKLQTSNEGGVSAGFGAMDSPYFV